MQYDKESHSVWLDDGTAIPCGLFDQHACMLMAEEAEAATGLDGEEPEPTLQIDITKTFVPFWMWAAGALLAFWWALSRKKGG